MFFFKTCMCSLLLKIGTLPKIVEALGLLLPFLSSSLDTSIMLHTIDVVLVQHVADQGLNGVEPNSQSIEVLCSWLKCIMADTQCVNNITFQYMTIKNILAVEVILERAGFRVEQQSNNTVYSLLFWWVMRK